MTEMKGRIKFPKRIIRVEKICSLVLNAYLLFLFLYIILLVRCWDSAESKVMNQTREYTYVN